MSKLPCNYFYEIEELLALTDLFQELLDSIETLVISSDQEEIAQKHIFVQSKTCLDILNDLFFL